MLAEQRVCSKGKRQCQLGKRKAGFLREELVAQVSGKNQATQAVLRD